MCFIKIDESAHSLSNARPDPISSDFNESHRWYMRMFVPSLALLMLGHTRIELSLLVDDYFEIVKVVDLLAFLPSMPPRVSFDSKLNLPVCI